ncbi:MAG TPA: hypothetical protein VFW77_04245, partial [Candidatus Saccharimonadales bacterium]|nr:hypothetical protein [Candidatus Saccharimonadales bacterium]
MPSGTVNHLFNFDIPSTSSADTIQFKYCTTEIVPGSGGSCTTPPLGLDVSGASLGNDASTGWTISSQTTDTVTISGTAIPNFSGSKTFRLDDVINPSATNTTFYVYIVTYSGGTSGTLIDEGAAAASTSSAINLEGTMPESLVFCTGGTVSVDVNNVPDCSTATSGDIDFNQLFSPTDTAWATSQMAASTNATSGYAITVNGPT